MQAWMTSKAPPVTQAWGASPGLSQQLNRPFSCCQQMRPRAGCSSRPGGPGPPSSLRGRGPGVMEPQPSLALPSEGSCAGERSLPAAQLRILASMLRVSCQKRPGASECAPKSIPLPLLTGPTSFAHQFKDSGCLWCADALTWALSLLASRKMYFIPPSCSLGPERLHKGALGSTVAIWTQAGG